VLKDGWYGFYKEYIVHYWFFDDFNQADYLLEHQADKPRYIPEKNGFLKYVIEDYAEKIQHNSSHTAFCCMTAWKNLQLNFQKPR
jgi:hypothetical protein